MMMRVIRIRDANCPAAGSDKNGAEDHRENNGRIE